MKTLMLALTFVIISSVTFAQADSVVYEYCNLRPSPRDMGSTAVHIELDFGEKRSAWRSYYLKDEAEKVRQFNSIIDALNFMGKKGWEVIAVVNVSQVNMVSSYEYLMKRKVPPGKIELDDK